MALTLLPTAAMAEGDSETPAGGEPTPVEAPVETKVAKVGDVKYDTLAKAVAAVADGGTVKLLKNSSGAAVGTYENPKTGQIQAKSFTIDFGGNTYTVTNPAAGSEGYESQAFHLERSSDGSNNHKVTFKNGTIATATDFNGSMLIQNYCDLTLDNMTIIGDSKISYVISNNFGSLTAKGNTVIKAADGKVAFDLWYGMNSNGLYDDGVSVTFGTDFTGSVTGKIEYGAHSRVPSDSNWKDKARLTIANGNFDTTFVDSNNNDGVAPEDFNISISGGTFSNLSCVKYMTADSKVTVDLNGKTVNGGADFYTGDLTIKNGTVEGTVWVNASTTDAEYNHLTVAADATIGKGDYAVVLYQAMVGANNFGSTIDVYGKLNGILWVQGNIKTDLKSATNPCVINVHDGAEIEDKTDATNVGIALNGAAILNVGKATIAGSTGIEVRAGQMTLNGATVIGKATSMTVKPNGSGTTTDGAGIAVAQHTTKLPIEVTINSGAISGYTAFYESNPQNNAAEDLAKINIAVKGGEFKAINGGTNTVYSESGKTGFITGGTFTGETAEEYLDEGCKLENGKVVPADDSVAKIGNKGYKTLADALNAVKDGETITLLKNAELPNAEYYINKSVTINGSGKISCTVKAGEGTRAFVVENNGSLTLDGVELDIQGTKNTDTAKKNDGTGIDVQYGGSLILKNRAVLNLHDLERGTISSKPDGSQANPGQFVIDNSTFNSTNIDGNVANGGDWKVTNGSVDINTCGSYGLSVDSLTTEQSTVNVSGTGYSAIYGKKLQFNDGSNVLISGAGTKLPLQSQWSDARSPIQTDKNGGTIVVDSGAVVTVQNCENKEGKANNTIYLPKNTTYTNNGTVNATIITDTAPENSFVVTLVSDGVTIGVQTVAKDSEFTLPAAPEKNNYTFKGWSDGSATHKAGDVVTITKNTTFTALWSYNGSSSGGGSSSSSRRYDVSAPSVKHGDVTVSPKNASKGDTVTITVKPDSGYELDTLTVKDASGSKIKVKDKGDGKFTFTMPASKVTVSAEFAEIETLDFADVSTDAYYYEAVKWAAKKGITGGTGDGTFNPNGSCTRAHIVTFLWRAAGSPEPKSTVSFTDVPAGSYYAKAVAWAVENGITLGTGDGTFSPNATCTRAQSVTFLYRALGTAPTTVNGFTDVTADAFYADAVAWAVESGVTNGTTDSTFSPNNGCTRAQIVTFLYRTMK